MVILIRSNDANPDPRLQKYIDYLEKTNQQYQVLAWNRDSQKIEKSNYIYLNLKTTYGLKSKNIPYKLIWFLFVIYQLFKNSKNYKLIHACDIDTVIPAYFVKIFTKKRILFDVFDWLTLKEDKGILNKIIARIENLMFKKVNYTILCEKYRISQVEHASRRDYFVLPNIPDVKISNLEDISINICEQRKQYKVVLSYVGVFDLNRGIEDVLKFVSENKDYCLNIAGFGNLENLVNKMSQENENIKHWGKVDYNRGLNIMMYSDLIIAFYYLGNKLHEYAAPNKYYEGLFLGKPLLTNIGTAVANQTIEGNTGFVIEEGLEAIENFFYSDYSKIENEKKINNANHMWKNSFKNYTENFMRDVYQKILE